MKKSEIKFIVSLDEKNIPEKIEWVAEDSLSQDLKESKSISLSLWDDKKKNTLRIDLWTKEMTTDDMKKFYIDCLGGLSQSILNSTGDEFMSKETNTVSYTHLTLPTTVFV